MTCVILVPIITLGEPRIMVTFLGSKDNYMTISQQCFLYTVQFTTAYVFTSTMSYRYQNGWLVFPLPNELAPNPYHYYPTVITNRLLLPQLLSLQTVFTETTIMQTGAIDTHYRT